ncbi:helix-turn-helix transcriptional regulator [Kushneria aurantia]|uniref:Helix-turn-helix transcriptional regulator n=1 Tax=Kushneria aurantia TaxID=504092 RepID=A0ABV6G336_9GAMM|nr:type II toxin-antitoxin system Y4mF family antitoxin [Kushneria aurantia]
MTSKDVSSHHWPRNIRSTADIGDVIRQMRQQQSLLQMDLAGLAGTGNRFIVDLERGKPTLQMQKVLDVLDLMGLEVTISPRHKPQ